MALAVRPELSRPPVQVPTVCHPAVPRAPAFRTAGRDLLRLFPQTRSLGGGHLELPDSSVAAAARAVEAGVRGGRGSRAVAHVLSAQGTVEL